MGTRNLTCVFLDGEYKVAQYGQFDGYLSGQGKTVLEFLKIMDETQFKKKLRATRFSTQINYDENDPYGNHPINYDRRTAAKILQYIYDQPIGAVQLHNNIDFAGDSLFCEWCYVIDFDKKMFEVYKGCNKIRLGVNDRFYNVKKENNSKYEQVKIVCSYKLSKLPSQQKLEEDAYAEQKAIEIMESVLNNEA